MTFDWTVVHVGTVGVFTPLHKLVMIVPPSISHSTWFRLHAGETPGIGVPAVFGSSNCIQFTALTY